MKKLLSGLIVFCFLFIGSFANVSALDEGFVITDYDIVIDVNEDGTYDIDEVITVFFNDSRHGIYRDIPIKYYMDWTIDGETYYRNYTFPITDIKSSEEYVGEDYGHSYRLRIGDPDRYVNGEKTYVINYTMHTKELELNGFEAFYLNVIGDQWDTYIQSANITINFPKPIDYDKMQVYVGESGERTSEGIACQYNGNANQVVCETTEELEPYSAITIFQELGGGGVSYFTFADYTNYYYLIIGLSGLVLLIVVFLFFKFGKDEKIIVPVEFNVPAGLDAASMGYVINTNADSRDFVALMIEWAKDGLIIIDDTNDDLKLIKVKDISPSAPKYQTTIFYGLFDGRDEVTTEQLKGTFSSEITKARTEISQYFDTKQKRLFSKNSSGAQFITFFLSALPITILILIGGSIYYRQFYFEFIAVIFIAVPILVLGLILIYIEKNWVVEKTFKKILPIVAAIGIIILNYSFGSGLISSYEIPELVYTAVYIITLIIIGIAPFMTKRTQYGMKVYAHCLGLRDFIKLAEADRIKVLAAENPKLFYDVLPYAYAFNLTDIWEKAFKDIDIPETEGFRTSGSLLPYMMLSSMNRSLNSLQAASAYKPPSSSSGGGFGGGGGFSGGGFGGGGGGSW